MTKPTKAEVIQELTSMLEYVRANLAWRKERPESCASDDFLVQRINNILSEDGMKNAVEIHRSVTSQMKLNCS